MRAMFSVFFLLAAVNGSLLALCVYFRDVCPLWFGLFTLGATLFSLAMAFRFADKMEAGRKPCPTINSEKKR